MLVIQRVSAQSIEQEKGLICKCKKDKGKNLPAKFLCLHDCFKISLSRRIPKEEKYGAKAQKSDQASLAKELQENIMGV